MASVLSPLGDTPITEPPFDPFETAELAPEGEVHCKYDQATGLKAVIAIHSTRRGPALGGCRLASYAGGHEALLDALRLAKGMSYKAAMAQLPHGGGKAVLIRPRQFPVDRALYFESFGRFVDSLGGRYITAEDVGTSVADMDAIARVTRFVAGTSSDGGDPSPFTALGVAEGILAAVRHRLGVSNLDGLRVAIQGVGHVGYHLAAELHRRGAKLIVADPDNEAAERCRDEFQARIVSPQSIGAADCEVFAPCAMGGAVNDHSLSQLRAKVVAGSANNQLATPRHGEALTRRGILYAPDYVINAGGLIHVTLCHQGALARDIRDKVLAIKDTLAELFRRADASRLPPHQLADTLAEERLHALGGPTP